MYGLQILHLLYTGVFFLGPDCDREKVLIYSIEFFCYMIIFQKMHLNFNH